MTDTQQTGPVCVNCGKPAVWKTTNPGADVAYFCDLHAQKAYPLNSGKLVLINPPDNPIPAPDEPPPPVEQPPADQPAPAKSTRSRKTT
jgi:hypothetical protein